MSYPSDDEIRAAHERPAPPDYERNGRQPEPSREELLERIGRLERELDAIKHAAYKQQRDAITSIATIILAAGGEVVIRAEHSQRAPGMQLGRAVLDDGSIHFIVRDTPTEPEPQPAPPEEPFTPDGL